MIKTIINMQREWNSRSNNIKTQPIHPRHNLKEKKKDAHKQKVSYHSTPHPYISCNSLEFPPPIF